MRLRYKMAIVFSALFLSWIGWNARSPSPRTPVLSTAQVPQTPQSLETPREPREIIDLSDIFEPIADEDRVPSINELVLVGYAEQEPEPPAPGWLKKFFEMPARPEPPKVWQFKGGPEIPGVSGSNAPTTDIRPGDLPKNIEKPTIE